MSGPSLHAGDTGRSKTDSSCFIQWSSRGSNKQANKRDFSSEMCSANIKQGHEGVLGRKSSRCKGS